MTTRIGLAMIVMLSMALGHIKAKREDLVRSLFKRAPTSAESDLTGKRKNP